MASWFSGALLVTPNNRITCGSFLQVLGKEKIVEKPKHPHLPSRWQSTACCLEPTPVCDMDRNKSQVPLFPSPTKGTWEDCWT